MRLVNVDDCDRELFYRQMGGKDSLITVETAFDMLNALPTAYDVDKVVQQLEEVGQKMSESKSIQKYGKSSPANHRYYKAVSVKRAIEIVKGGGVDEV